MKKGRSPSMPLQTRRDKRAPPPSSLAVSKVMKANKGKNTTPEIMLRRALRDAGLSGYRLHWDNVIGRPDICYPGRKVAVFVNGCFWHRCPICNLKPPKTHPEYWKSKFERNVKRDGQRVHDLESEGWTVLVVWECEVRKDKEKVVRRISQVVSP